MLLLSYKLGTTREVIVLVLADYHISYSGENARMPVTDADVIFHVSRSFYRK